MIVLCADPFDARRHDAAFDHEAAAAAALGLGRILVDHNALDRAHDGPAAVRRSRFPDHPATAFYRGWMLKAGDYALLHAALAARGVTLLNDPRQYAACHHVPGSYATVSRWSAQTVFAPADAGVDDLLAALAPFGRQPVVLKDWVKSQAAGYWDTACLITDAGDADKVAATVSRFRELQGADLVGGLVFRAYVPLAKAGGETEEWRAFCLDGRVIGCWPRLAAAGDAPPPGLVADVAAVLPSRFATADFARRADGGGWLLVETGDGQVSGLPGGVEPDALLRPLAEAVS